MRRFICAIGILAAALSASTAFAAITYTGGTNGLSPNGGWTSGTTGYVGYKSNGSITIDQSGSAGGSLASSAAYIGGYSNSYNTAVGTVTIIGGASPSNWTNSGILYVGDYGTGNLSLQSGGSLSTTTGYIGYNTDGNCNGTASIDGAYSGTPSTWTTNSNAIYVGYNHTGALNITNGGSVTDSYGYIGGYSTTASGSGTVTVDGMNDSTPSTWSDSNSVYVGYNGTGALNITNGGSVNDSVGTAYIGYNSGKTGTVTVDGVNNGISSQLACTAAGMQLDVGYNGAGVLKITNGGQVSNTGIGNVGGTTSVGNTSTGTVTIDGSSGGIASKWTCGYTFYGAAYGTAPVAR